MTPNCKLSQLSQVFQLSQPPQLSRTLLCTVCRAPLSCIKNPFNLYSVSNVFCFVWYGVTVLRCYLHLRWHYFDSLTMEIPKKQILFLLPSLAFLPCNIVNIIDKGMVYNKLYYCQSNLKNRRSTSIIATLASPRL